jgi:hypothetical protein
MSAIDPKRTSAGSLKQVSERSFQTPNRLQECSGALLIDRSIRETPSHDGLHPVKEPIVE